ncbi:MAG: cytochrome c, partial [Deltaproteobacteria bacterium]|nr:cytochrome c [Deltaproteobacteria bacterium]
DSTIGGQGPGLQGLFKRDKLPSGRDPSEENIRDQIQGGGDTMPPFRLPEEELNTLVQYLKTL